MLISLACVFLSRSGKRRRRHAADDVQTPKRACMFLIREAAHAADDVQGIEAVDLRVTSSPPDTKRLSEGKDTATVIHLPVLSRLASAWTSR